MLLDQFTPTDGKASNGAAYDVNNNAIASQQSWISSTLSGRPADTQAFVFGHKGLITENHTDVLLGANPCANPAAQNGFIGSLQDNGVRYYIGGHDHMHDRAIVASPDGAKSVQDIVCASDSSKFYGPKASPNAPTGRETLVAQDLGTIGYYVYNVDGPRVTADYYSSSKLASPPAGGEADITTTPALTFSKKESFGYSLNGKEFVVGQGQAYSAVQDTIAAGSHNGENGYLGTAAKILGGTNASTLKGANDNRPLSKAIDTGWSPNAGSGLISDVLTLWGMTDVGANKTDTFTLSMSYDGSKLSHDRVAELVSWDGKEWVNAVDLNNGGVEKFVEGAWNSSYGLGTYGFDPTTDTAWAVIDHASSFGVAAVPEPSSLVLCSGLGVLGLFATRRKLKRAA